MVESGLRATRRRRWKWRREYWGYVCVIPAIAWIVGVMLVPLIDVLLISLQNAAPSGSSYAGLAHYQQILTGNFGQTLFWPSTWRTVWFTVGSVVSHLVVGLGLALLVNNVRWRALFRGIVLIPWVMPGIVVAFIWLWMYQDQYGMINGALSHLGLAQWRQAWLGQAGTALPAVLVANVWRHSVFDTIMFLAGLQGIPRDYYEAASMDGAGAWQSFRHVTIPALRSITLTVTLLDFIWSFGAFDLIWLMTGGGPMDTTHVLGTLVYRTAFRYIDVPEGAAVATVMFVFIAVAAVGYVWLSRRLAPEDLQ
ncbi:MAG TPA: sugar ABC transporter permease [Chloroflexota bacterium]|nr:sugar ABC transporter permease [Chloroflexota bacterium]